MTLCRIFFSFLFLIGIVNTVYAQHKDIDVRHYSFKITVNDSNNVIQGVATITFVPVLNEDKVHFDLNAFNDSTGKGMKVSAVLEKQSPLQFSQEKNSVTIYYDHTLKAGEQKAITIVYQGIPADGLIIDKNEFGHRTFFADNWPERAHYWIPCNDHPADKASVEFIVIAPDHYKVIGNGILVKKMNLSQGRELTHWKEDLDLPVKVMAIGIADFAVQEVNKIDGVPVSSWVFSGNRDSGFAQYAVSPEILSFFIKYIGPYPYRKLANVQSKTRFGGLEDASNIFYNEKSVLLHPEDPVRHRLNTETLMAHETAHQWFGNEATEIDWPHLWLSEGFATYLTHLYIEHTYGEERFKNRLILDRMTVIAFDKNRKTPVVDTSENSDPMQLLNANTYQKGGWVLHMLRRKIGDSLFQEGLRTYYATYKGKNASTKDFRKVMEKVSGQNLEAFFKQWLFTPGYPVLRVSWKYNEQTKILHIAIDQRQDTLFQFPLQIGIKGMDKSIISSIPVSGRHTITDIRVDFIPKTIVLDPNVNLLFEGKVEKEK